MAGKLIFIGFLLLPVLGQAQSLGDYYYQKEHYFEAITEYKRQLCLGQSADTDSLLYKIARSYYAGEQRYEAASYLLQQLSNTSTTDMDRNALVLLARIYWENYEYGAMRNVLDYLAREYPSVDRDTVRYIKAWTHIYSAEWDTALAILQEIEWEQSGPLIADIRAVEDVPRKSRKLAVVMSNLIPGSGQLYAGDYRNAAYSFLLVGSIAGSMIWNVTQGAYFVALVKYLFLYSRYARGGLKQLAKRVDKDNIDRIGEYLRSLAERYPKAPEMLTAMQTEP